jgi:hypothetical protein
VGATNVAYWVPQYDGEPWWDSGAQYYPGDVVSYTASASYPPIMYQSLTKNTGISPEAVDAGASTWKPLADGFVSAVRVAGASATTTLYNEPTFKGGAGVSVEYDSGSEAIVVANTGVLGLQSRNLSINGLSGDVSAGNLNLFLKEGQVAIANFLPWDASSVYTVGTPVSLPVSIPAGSPDALYVCWIGVGPSANTPASDPAHWAPIGQNGKSLLNSVTVSSNTPAHLCPSSGYSVVVSPGAFLTFEYSSDNLNVILPLINALISTPLSAIPSYGLPSLTPPTYTRTGTFKAAPVVNGSCGTGTLLATVQDLSLDGNPFVPIPDTGKMWLYNGLMGHF